MRLDPGTLRTVTVLLFLLFTLLVAAIWWTRRTLPGYGRWSAAGLFCLASPLLALLRPLASDWVSVVGANAFLSIGSILYLEGARVFRGLRPRLWPIYVAGAAAMAALWYFDFIAPSVNARIFAISLFLAIVLTLASITLLRDMPAGHKFGSTLTGGMFALCAGTFAVRAIHSLFAPHITSSSTYSRSSTLFLVAISVEIVGAGIGIILLADEKTVADLTDAKDNEMRAQAEAARRREAESIARESEERFREMANTAPVLIWIFDANQNCVFLNSRWLEFTGRTLEQAVGQGWTSSIHPEDLDRCLQAISQPAQTRGPFQIEHRLLRAGGDYRSMLCSGVPRFQAGFFRGYIGSCVDITDFKRAQEEALALQKLESVGTLAGGIAHDFNNLWAASWLRWIWRWRSTTPVPLRRES